MRVGLLSKEYPPQIYGGAGVHVDFLSRALRRLVDLDIHTWGPDRPDATGHHPAETLAVENPALATLSTDLSMAAALSGVDVVHSHTWYANLGGHLAALLYGIPHVVTAHSLEPRRPWKREQLAGGYDVSCWIERTALEAADAVIAVSHGMRADVLDCYPGVDPARVHVVHNGIDTSVYQPDSSREVWARIGVDPAKPTVVFIGRITRQKGVTHLLRAAVGFRADVQLVLCAGAADTPELEQEVSDAVSRLREVRSGVHWIPHMLQRSEAIQLLSAATVFVCPSIYEPLGIVNLEAMACGAPVVASAVGGIPEVVADQSTGLLVGYDANRVDAFEHGLAEAVNTVVDHPDRAASMGAAGRERAVTEFGWDPIARATVAVYEAALARHAARG